MAEYQDAAAPAQVPDTVTTVRYRCESCGKGDMKVGGTVYTCDPPKYEHICAACGKRAAFDRIYPYARTTYRDAGTLEQAEARLKMMGEALGQVLVAAGMIREDASMSGPELLLAAETYCDPGEDAFAGQKLAVGAKVARDDGRFYVPVSRTAIRLNDARSMTVLRVASDAFDTVAQAEEFAQGVVDAWNAARRIKD
ncbi:hypothetical protein MARCHEWKA_03550 [Brevundimonas phage vB_BpoS-Marchewka]|uniref:Uncharacterized protein n=1 Tax=Brevundimonas phage vB_BpoS-Marchewka TaxID=2948604 RepID=A0A9E7STY3_9CAUD|nr:hypothetical protein MARCHEWKA_03550 [Brevundimonas phage vB_BpoS-Marchewka]UTC29313.1 hypothetical protein BAMBUS_02310 [Brevundimonas phage vB_BpoS-Bambus]